MGAKEVPTLLGISEDEFFCQSLGKNVGLAKLQSFVLGAMLAAVPGDLPPRHFQPISHLTNPIAVKWLICQITRFFRNTQHVAIDRS